MNARVPSSSSPRAGWNAHSLFWIAFTIAVLWLSGLWLHQGEADRLAADPGATQMQWQHAASVVHGVFAWVACLVAGRWIWPHVALVFAYRGKRWIWIAGLLVAVAGAVAALSGLGLLYGAADWREFLSAAHWAAGLGWPVLFVLHGWRALTARLALRSWLLVSRRRIEPRSGAPDANRVPHADT